LKFFGKIQIKKKKKKNFLIKFDFFKNFLNFFKKNKKKKKKKKTFEQNLISLNSF